PVEQRQSRRYQVGDDDFPFFVSAEEERLVLFAVWHETFVRRIRHKGSTLDNVYLDGGKAWSRERNSVIYVSSGEEKISTSRLRQNCSSNDWGSRWIAQDL